MRVLLPGMIDVYEPVRLVECNGLGAIQPQIQRKISAAHVSFSEA